MQRRSCDGESEARRAKFMPLARIRNGMTSVRIATFLILILGVQSAFAAARAEIDPEQQCLRDDTL